MSKETQSEQIAANDLQFCPPIDRVKVSHEFLGECVVWINYAGRAADLIAIGAIEPNMDSRGRPGIRRLDSYGDNFSRSVGRDGTISVCRLVTNLARARALPG